MADKISTGGTTPVINGDQTKESFRSRYSLKPYEAEEIDLNNEGNWYWNLLKYYFGFNLMFYLSPFLFLFAFFGDWNDAINTIQNIVEAFRYPQLYNSYDKHYFLSVAGAFNTR